MGLLVLLGFLFVWLAKDLPITEQDKQVLVTAAWVAEWNEDWEPDSTLESFEKIRNIDDSYELVYEYDGEEIYISCDIGVDDSPSDAKGSYLALIAGHAIGLRIAGVTLRDRRGLLSWGQQSKCALIVNEEGSVVGNYFACRKGKRTFALMLVGLYFDESESLREFLVPLLERLDKYQP